MPSKDEMTIDERRKYVKLMAERYRKASRRERSELLSEMEQVSKLHRKHLIRLLNGKSLERKRRKTPRSRSYGVEVERVVMRVWESLDYICAERLTPSLVRMAQHLAGFGAVVLTAEVENQPHCLTRNLTLRFFTKHSLRIIFALSTNPPLHQFSSLKRQEAPIMRLKGKIPGEATKGLSVISAHWVRFVVAQCTVERSGLLTLLLLL